MPDPRRPQRPPQRQPVPHPHSGRPVERMVPHDPNADKVPGIHVGDPAAAAARAGGSRPVRTLDPSQQPPPIEFERKIIKGQIYWIMGHEEVPVARKGKVIRLTSEPGKAVGIEFEEPIGGVDSNGQPWGVAHTCDGRGKNGHCLYVRPDQVLDEKSMQTHKARMAELAEPSPFEELEEMTVGPQHSQPLTPAMEEREMMSIGHEDVGKVSATDIFKAKTEEEEEDKGKEPDEDE
jgi:hypothetical protein